MGGVLSVVLDPWRTLTVGVGILRDLAKQYCALDRRFDADPGLPHSAPTRPFWLDAPPFPELVNIQSEQLPEQADVVIIGSGISGAAIARGLFGNETKTTNAPSVVVLEARELCSGATGRNGGHIKASPHETLSHLITKLGLPGDRAAALVRFQLAHLDTLVDLCASDPDLFGVAECRRVETVDLIVEDGILDEVRHAVALLKQWVPEVEMTFWSGAEAQKRFHAGPHVVGAVSYAAGALWPYRFVTAVWKSLLDAHVGRLAIETSTPAMAIVVDVDGDAKATDFPYRVTTPRGVVRARHVVHATNAYVSHLLPQLRRKVTGMRAHMSAQHAGPRFAAADLNGGRSWSVIYNSGFDYITQRPSRTVPNKSDGSLQTEPGEVMTGGGFVRSAEQGRDQLGVYDDSVTDLFTELHLHGVLPTVFGGAHRGSSSEASGGHYVKSLWSGIIGYSADLLPLVGRLEPKLTGRPCGGGTDTGEWVSAVFQGDGMVWAWLCGTALGLMVAGRGDEDLPPAPGRPSGRVADWFPKEMLATHERFKRVDITRLADLLL